MVGSPQEALTQPAVTLASQGPGERLSPVTSGMMVAMPRPCKECGAERTYVRHRYDIAYPGGALIAEEVPSLRCQGCGRTDPAPHALPQVEAVISLVEEVSAVARKDFSAVPLQPGDATRT